MLPGSIRFTVTQVSRDEDEGAGEENMTDHRFAGDVGSSGRLSNENDNENETRTGGNIIGSGKRSSQLSPSPAINDEDNTLYLHLTGDPVSMGKLFTATKQYVQHCLSHSSFGIWSNKY